MGGILCAGVASLPLWLWLCGAAGFWLATVFAFLVSTRLRVFFLLAGFLWMGGALWSLDQAGIREDRIKRLFDREGIASDEAIELWGRLTAAPELAPDRIYLGLTVERIKIRDVVRTASGYVELLVPFNDDDDRKDYDALGLEYGNRLRLLCYLRRQAGYRNPGSAEFQAMLEQRGVDAIGLIKSPLLIERLDAASSRGLPGWLYRLRGSAIAALLRNLSQPTSGLLVALNFGNRYFLDRRPAESFRSGGTFHLLVISGSHVGLIAAFLLWVTMRLVRIRLVRFGLVFFLIWAYALMVGAQPAVTRSATMLSVALVAQSLYRRQSGANILGAATIALLAWQPRDLFNPAFQLSFLTVLCMSLWTGPIYDRLKSIGEWKPSESTPYPPRVSRPIKWFAEAIFWDERAFRVEMTEARIRYRLNKAVAAHHLGRLQLSGTARWIAITLLTTIGIQLCLLPMMVAYFHRVSLSAPVANVVEAALVFALMIGGSAFLLVYAINQRLAGALTAIMNGFGELSVRISHWLDRHFGGSYRVPDFGDSSTWVYGLFFLVALTLVLLLERWNPLTLNRPKSKGYRRRVFQLLVIICPVLLSALTWVIATYPFQSDFTRDRLTVVFLDVGQGDAIVISFPGGTLMMLDSGGRPSFRNDLADAEGEPYFIEDRPGVGELAIAPFLWRHGVKRIDMITASHGDADHIQGFVDLIDDFEIGAALAGPTLLAGDPAWPFPRSLTQKDIPRRTLKRGEKFEVGGVRVDVLTPFQEMASTPTSSNNRSIVMRLTWRERSFLLTGDIEREVESKLVATHDDLRADVLKVAHHGSRTSSISEFLARVAPRFAVISVASPSPFGHPHDEVLQRLRATGARLLMTSHCGAIAISTDGQDLRCETFVKCE